MFKKLVWVIILTFFFPLDLFAARTLSEGLEKAAESMNRVRQRRSEQAFLDAQTQVLQQQAALIQEQRQREYENHVQEG